MADQPQRSASARRRPSARALATYAAVWTILGAAFAAFVIVSGDDAPEQLPPVRERELSSAVHTGRCALRSVREPEVDPRTTERPATAREYELPPASPALSLSVRRGDVVLRYDPGLDDDDVELLRAMRDAVPEATILAPGGTEAGAAVLAAAYGRRLSCPRLTRSSLDALRLFRGRYLGSGPD